MASELMIPGGDNKLALPAHIAARFKPEDSNILTGDRTPSLTIMGKVFTITKDGETNQLMKKDEDGNEYPLASLPVFIVDYAAKMGRSYYKDAFDPKDPKPPTCWSLDSITPEDEVEEKQHPKCAGCPMSIKGSSINDRGQSAVACGSHRILAVVPARRMDLGALRLRIAQTSNFDGRSPEHKAKGMFAFQNYLDMIKARGIPHTQSIVTRLSFDPNAAFPKLLFSALRFAEDEEIARIDDILSSGAVEQILGATSTAAVKANPQLAAPAAKAALPAPDKAVNNAASAIEVDDEEAEVAGAATPAAKAQVQAELEVDEEAAMAAKLEAIRARKAKAQAEAEEAAKAEAAEARRKAEAAAKAKREAEAAQAAAAQPAEDEDEEAALERMLAAARAKKAAAQSADTTAALKASVAASEAKATMGTGHAAEAPATNGTKRTRRTKEQIEADNAKAAAAAKVGDEKFLPKAIDPTNFGDDDEGGTMVLPPEKPVSNGGGAAAAPKADKPKVIDATAVQVPADVASMLQSWDD